MTADKHYPLKFKDIRLGDNVVLLLDHQRKRVEILLKVTFPATEIDANSDEVGNRISHTLDYLRHEGFFPEDEPQEKPVGYQVKFHFLHSMD